MAQKAPGLITLAVVAVAAALVTQIVNGWSRKSDAAPGGTAVEDRLARLESDRPRLERSLAQTGATLGAAALVRAGEAPSPEPAEGTAEGDAAEARKAAEQAAKESRHFDELDVLARSGGGAAAAAQLRTNIEDARGKPSGQGGVDLDVGRMDCSDSLCRIELRPHGDIAVMSASSVLMRGMGNLRMRPASAGQPHVYYVAAPGKRLPHLEL